MAETPKISIKHANKFTKCAVNLGVAYLFCAALTIPLWAVFSNFNGFGILKPKIKSVLTNVLQFRRVAMNYLRSVHPCY